MKKSDINPMPEYFDRYINLVADVELSEAFDQSIQQLDSLDKDLLNGLNGKRYAPDKWTVNEVVQHVADFERIISYRALLFARKEGSIPQGIDENALAANTNANSRPIADIIEELKLARFSTKAMFDGFDDEILQNRGTNWKYEVSVLGMGFTIIGHQIHHFKVIEDKYYPMPGR